MKRFTVPCDFAGVKYPFHVYIGEPHPENHPLTYQAAWLRDVRGGVVPQEVMDSFARLHAIARENNVSYEDLCVYALGTEAAEGAQQPKSETSDAEQIDTAAEREEQPKSETSDAEQEDTAAPEPTKEWVGVGVIRTYLEADRADEALAIFKQLCAHRSGEEGLVAPIEALLRDKLSNWKVDEVLEEVIAQKEFAAEAGFLWLDRLEYKDASSAARLAVVDRILKVYPDHPAALQRRNKLEKQQRELLDGWTAWTEAERGSLTDAIARMEALLADSPDFVWGWQELARWYEQTGQLENQLRAAERLVQLADTEASSYSVRGQAHLRLGREDQAHEDFRQALNLDRSHIPAALPLFELSRRKGDMETARECLADLDVDQPEVQKAVLQLAIWEGRRDESFQLLNSWLREKAAPPAHFHELVALLQSAGWIASAWELMHELSRQPPA